MDHDAERNNVDSSRAWVGVDGQTTPAALQDHYEELAQVPFLARFKLVGSTVPSAAARDFCARERNYLSWIKQVTLLFVLACAMFLEIQVQSMHEMESNTAEVKSMLHIPQTDQTTVSTQQRFSARSEDKAKKETGPSSEYLTLGIIYIVAAFLGFFASFYDYYNCISELENEHIYMDECEGHTHPVVTLISALIVAVVLGTAILMIVQRE